MKLAQALTLRKQLKNGLSLQAQKIQRNATRSPDYSGKLSPKTGDASDDVRDLMSMGSKLESLISAINDANNSVVLSNGLTIGQALTQRDIHTQLSAILSSCAGIRNRAGDVLELDVATVSKMADNSARIARELDDLIQQANWNTDVSA